MVPNKFRKGDRCLAVLMSVVFSTATNPPISAQPATSSPSQSPTTANSNPSDTPQTMPTLGGQLAVLVGHKGDINYVKFSPDGSYILTASNDQTARLWDRKGNLLAILQHQDRVSNAEFSPDGDRILTTSGHASSLYLWNIQGKLLSELRGGRIARFSPDGNFILTVGYADKTGRLWDRQGKALAELQHKGDIDSAEFSPDGNQILTASRDDTAQLWDIRGNPVVTLQHGSRLMSAEFSSDGRHIVTTNFRSHIAHLWDRKGNLIARIENYSDDYGHVELDSAKFSPDGSLILTQAQGMRRFWDREGKYLAIFQAYNSYANTTEFSPDSRYIITASDDGTARVWDRQGNATVVLQHKQPVKRAEFSPNGKYILTTSWSSWGDKTIRIWDRSGKPLAAFRREDKVAGVEVSADGSQILVWGDDTARLWNTSVSVAAQTQQIGALQNFNQGVAERNAQMTLLEHEQAVGSAEFSPDGRYILTTTFNGMEPRLWDRRGNLLATLRGHVQSVQSAKFSPDGSTILTTGLDNTARLWNKQGNSLSVFPSYGGARATFSPDGRYILTSSGLMDQAGKLVAEFRGQSAVLSPDGNFLLTAENKTAYLWDKAGHLITEFQGHKYRTHSPRFSPDGQYVFIAYYFETARLWDKKANLLTTFQHQGEVTKVEFSPDNRHILILSYHPLNNPGGSFSPTAELWHRENNTSTPVQLGRVTSAKFSPDGQNILTTRLDNEARLLDKKGNTLTVFQHEQRVESAAFNPDGNLVITTSADNTARLWDKKGNLLVVFRGHKDLITSAVFRSDSRQVITASQDNTARVWDVATAIEAQAAQVAALQSTQTNLPKNNNQQATAAFQQAVQLNQRETIESRQLALQKLKDALNLYRADKNLVKMAEVLLYIGNIQANLGEFQNALDSYTQALPFAQQAGALAESANIFNGLGQLYKNLANPDTARSFYNQALPLLYQINNKSGAAATLNNIGDLDVAAGNYEDGLKSYNQALTLSQSAGDKAVEASVLMSIGSIHTTSKQWQSALSNYSQALILARFLNDRVKETAILNQIGKVHASLGEDSKALEQYNQALTLARQLGYKTEEANILYNQALLSRQQNNLVVAKTNIETAIQITETLRSQIASQELRQSYFARNQAYYQFYIDLLMQLHQQSPSQGYDALALHISERARARSLLEQLTEASLNFKANLDPTLLAEEKRLTQALNSADQKRLNLLNNPKGYSNPDLEAAKAEINDILQQLKRLEAQIRRANPAYANLKYPEPLTLSEIQSKILDDRTLLLQYALGEERSYLFLVSKNGLKTYKLPPKAEIETAVEKYRQLLQSPNFTDLTQGQQLSQMLLGQIGNELKGQRLVIVGDGKLQLLPFAALPWGSGTKLTPLLANHQLIALPSATSLAVQREQWQKRPQAPKTLAMIADPVFKANDSRLGSNARTIVAGDLSQEPSLLLTRNGCGDFDRLEHTQTEAQQILSLVPDAQKFSAMGFDANYTTATQSKLSQYKIVHIATHGCIQDNPLLSNLALSFFKADGQKAETSLLKLQDIYNLELNADLVVLSACQTGTGKEVQGEGVVGLTRGFMYAGARRVVVSLWSVNDRATSILMSSYYHQMLKQGLDPAAALQQAQLTMWQSGNHSAPYYWAAFTIQGDW